MLNFSFTFPSNVIFGAGVFQSLGEEVTKFGKTALLVEQAGPLEPVFARGVALMEAAGVKVTELSGVESNPRLSKVEEGIKIVKEQNIEVVVAIGGGSTIDTAKAISVGAADEENGDVWDFFADTRDIKKVLPVVAVSTISATGAETSCHCVVTNNRSEDHTQWKKWAIHNTIVCPKTAIIDPELLVSVPTRLTAAGMADTISHIIEGYFDGVGGNPISDAIGEGIVRTVLDNDGVLQDPGNIDMRSQIAWASTLAMGGIQDCGRLNAGWPAHWIQHAVGALTDSSHGEGLAVINPAWLDFVNEKNPEKFVRFADKVLEIERPGGISDVAYGQMGLDELRARFKKWGLPSTLKELGVTKDMFPTLIQNIMNNNESFQFTEKQIEQVLERCYE